MPLPDGNDTVANITVEESGLAISDLPAAGPFDLARVENARFSLDLPSQQVLGDGAFLFGNKPDLLSDEDTKL